MTPELVPSQLENRHVTRRSGGHQQVRPTWRRGRISRCAQAVRRNREMFHAPDEALPVVGTISSRFSDDGVNGAMNSY